MKILQLTQGTPEWHAHRATARNASEAAAMLGESPYMSRAELLKQKATGIIPEVTPAQQAIFDRGHAIEAACRPCAEKELEESLSACVATSDDGYLSASFDGITFDESIVWECKTLNNSLREAMKSGSQLPLHYRAQLEQQLMVSGAPKAFFIAANDDLSEIESCWYESDPELRARIFAGWKQFDIDLANWQPVAEEAPAAVGRAPESLPALRIEVQGQVLASNLSEFKAQALAVFNAINTDLQTDQDFADAEKTAKWCKGIEEKLEQAKENALSQTASIEEIFRTADGLKEVARQTRLTLEKAVKAQKEAKKTELVMQAQSDYAAHLGKLQLDLQGLRLNAPAPNFGEAIKGLKTVASMKERLTATLIEANATANSTAGRIVNNLKMLDSMPSYAFLFADRQQLCEKDAETLELIIKQRVENHEREQAAKLEAERQRIESEAKAKAEQEAQAAVRAQMEAERQAQASVDDERRRAEDDALQAIADTDREMAQEARTKAEPVVKEPLAAETYDGVRIKLGEINARLAPISITAAGLEQLGFVGTKEKNATLYRECDFVPMCRAIHKHITEVAKGIAA